VRPLPGQQAGLPRLTRLPRRRLARRQRAHRRSSQVARQRPPGSHRSQVEPRRRRSRPPPPRPGRQRGLRRLLRLPPHPGKATQPRQQVPQPPARATTTRATRGITWLGSRSWISLWLMGLTCGFVVCPEWICALILDRRVGWSAAGGRPATWPAEGGPTATGTAAASVQLSRPASPGASRSLRAPDRVG